jgi:capsular polysaccharide biosynthesis protein
MDAREQIENLERQLVALRKKYYLKSFIRKAKRLVTDFLPLQNADQSIIVTEKTILPAAETDNYLPKKQGENQVKISTPINAVKIYELENVYCISNSTFFLTLKKDKIFYEKWHDDKRIHYVYHTTNLLQNAVTLAKVQNRKSIRLKEEAIFLGGIFTFNYYHFVLEILSKTEFFSEIPEYHEKIVIVDEVVTQNENMKTLLSFFVKDNNIRFVDHQTYFNFEKLWHITSPNYTIPNIVTGEKYEAGFSKFTPSSVQYLRKICLENLDLTKVKTEKVEKVFIARKSQFRKYNEAEIIKVAKDFGFQEVFFEDLNIHEQIFMVQNAKYITGPSGAAWTNLLFADSNAKGLTWLSSVWGDFSVYSTMAKIIGFDLNYYIYPQVTEDFHEDYILNPKIFAQHLKTLLA